MTQWETLGVIVLSTIFYWAIVLATTAGGAWSLLNMDATTIEQGHLQ